MGSFGWPINSNAERWKAIARTYPAGTGITWAERRRDLTNLKANGTDLVVRAVHRLPELSSVGFDSTVNSL